VGKGAIIREGALNILKCPSARIFWIVEKPTPSTQMMMCRDAGADVFDCTAAIGGIIMPTTDKARAIACKSLIGFLRGVLLKQLTRV